ncbi:GNAT family N-acetyltransferase [Geminicoccaceae bacterium 1502E]|nr:GNAT family N-acetyltransferase [Geminicoccaceae bacterium 1502E]
MQDALVRVTAQLERGMAAAGEAREAGGWRVFLPEGHPYYRRCALPLQPAGRSGAGVQDLRRLAGELGLAPRVELVRELWPELPAMLAAHGFMVETEAAILVAQAAPAGLGGAVPVGETADARLQRRFLAATARAFGEAPPSEAELAIFSACLRGRSIRAATWIEAGGPVSGAALLRTGPDAELAGVWTETGWRRRGLAARVGTTLLDLFFASGGAFVWLAAAQEQTRLYEALGFRRAGTLLRLVPGSS